jgi:multiple sugar transport system substrate-binding protein
MKDVNRTAGPLSPRLGRGSVRLAAGAVIAGGALMASACGTSGPASSTQSSQHVLTVWDRSDIYLTPGLVKEFNKTHKDLKVELTTVDTTDEPTKLATAIRAGDPPDLAIMDDTQFGSFMIKGVLEKTTSELKSLPFAKYLNSGQLASVTENGQYYGFPAYADLSIMYYNKTLFEKAGLNPNQPPTTFAQILSDSQAISKLGAGDYGFSFAGNCGGCIAFTMYPTLFAAGTNIVSGPINDQKATVTGNQPLKEALSLYRTLWADHLVPTSDRTDNGATWGNDFEQGKVGIVLQSYQFSTTLQKAHTSFDWGVAKINGPNGGYSTYDGGADFGIPTGSKNAAGAYEFVKWMLSQPVQEQYPSYGYTPVRTDLLNATYQKNNPVDAVALAALKNGNLHLGASAAEIDQPVSGALPEMFDKAVYNGQIDAALTQGQQAVTTAINGAK